RDALTADVVRANILAHGSLCVRGLLDPAQVDQFVTGIDRALEVRAELPSSDARRNEAWYVALPLEADEAASLGRHWVAGSGGVLAGDSPHLLNLLFETYDDLGVRDVVAEYLGELPVLSANKCTRRKVLITANTDWHQDGAFLGRGIRALNIWVALSDC